MSFEVDIPTTEEVLAAVLSSSLPALPPSEQRLGSTLVSWWETAPGEVYIHAEGGTGDDRHYARTMVGLELMQHGYARRTFDLDVIHLGSRRTASWVDTLADILPPVTATVQLFYRLTDSEDRNRILQEGFPAGTYLMPEIPYDGDLSIMDDYQDIWEVRYDGSLSPDANSDDWEEYTGQPGVIADQPIPPQQIRLLA